MAEPDVLLKAHTLTVNAPTGDTSQPKEDQWLGTPDDALTPPLPLETLQQLSTYSSVRSSAVDAIARNTVGLGYNLVAEDDREQEVGDVSADARTLRALLETLASRDRRLDAPSLNDLLYAVKHDEEEMGWGFLEVSRSKLTGQIDGLFHLPAVRMRRRKDRDGYFLMPVDGSLDNITRFYDFGTKVSEDAEGKPRRLLQPGRRWNTNEVLVFKLYTSEDRDHGMPRDVAMALDYLGDKLASESNIAFFDSSGTPPTIIFVQGEEQKDGSRVTFKVPQETADRIAATLKSDGGHRSRVAIIPVPPGTTTKDVKLGETSERDMGHTEYRKQNARRTLGAFRLQPIFVSDVDDSGRYTAEVQRAITLEQLFDPEQTRYEVRLGETLIRDLGYGHLRIVFRRLAIEDDATRRESANDMAEKSVITRREYRKAHGFGPLPEGDGEGHVPVGWNDELVSIAPPAGAQNRGGPVDNRGLDAGIGGRDLEPEREDRVPASSNGHA